MTRDTASHSRRSRRARPTRGPRWYLVDGQPRRTLWPPEAALIKTKEAQQLLSLAREAAKREAGSSRIEQRRWIREFLGALEHALTASDRTTHPRAP